MAMKLAAGHFGRSEAVFADGVESACDFVALLTTMIALRIGRRPFDANHPYGHGKAESLAAGLVALVISSPPGPASSWAPTGASPSTVTGRRRGSRSWRRCSRSA
jgi:Cation efflux family